MTDQRIGDEAAGGKNRHGALQQRCMLQQRRVAAVFADRRTDDTKKVAPCPRTNRQAGGGRKQAGESTARRARIARRSVPPSGGQLRNALPRAKPPPSAAPSAADERCAHRLQRHFPCAREPVRPAAAVRGPGTRQPASAELPAIAIRQREEYASAGPAKSAAGVPPARRKV